MVFYDAGGDDAHCEQHDSACSIASLDEDTLEDLQSQLDMELQSINRRYNSYITLIHECLEAKEVCPRDLAFKLLSLSAFNHTDQKPTLLSSHKTQLEGAADLYGIFSLLITEYASFLNYDIFQFMVDKYLLDNGQEEFKYPDHLKAYLNKHKISEFVKINPLLKDFSDASKKLILKMDIELTSELAKLGKFKTAVAKILGLKSAALRLLDVKDGCVVATFTIPTPVADIMFNKNTIFTEKQLQEFRALPVLWLECNNCMFNFNAKKIDEEEEAR